MKPYILFILMACLPIIFSSCSFMLNKDKVSQQMLEENEQAKKAYALGYVSGNDLKKKFTEKDSQNAYIMGMKDSLTGKESAIDNMEEITKEVTDESMAKTMKQAPTIKEKKATENKTASNPKTQEDMDMTQKAKMAQDQLKKAQKMQDTVKKDMKEVDKEKKILEKQQKPIAPADTNTQKEESNMEEGKKFLENNKKKADVKSTSSGLQYKVLKEGSGKKPVATDNVEVHYRGTFIDGKEFDSSYKRKQSITFPLNGVIKGWTEGLQLMKEGAKYEFYIPSDLAYGASGTAGIPPNSVLIFQVELIKVK